MNSERAKGYFFAALGTVAFSNVYIFSKAALNEIHIVQFGFYWYLVAFGLSFGWLVKTGKHKIVPALSKQQVRILLLLGFLEIITNTTFFLSVHIIPDPAVTSFLGNLFPVFLALMGIVFLRERFTWIESVGGALALAGAFIVSYRGGTTFSDLFIPGTGVVVVNALFAATASIVVKINVRKMSPELLNANHAFWLLIFSGLMMIVLGKPFAVPLSALKNIAIGAFLAPFLGVLTLYYSFHYIEVSKSSVVQGLKGIFVLIGGYLYLHTLPLPHQLIGGGITILGIMVMSMAQAGFFNRKERVEK